MSGLAMSNPWNPLTAEAIAAVPAQLGVFEIGDSDGVVLEIGYAGGRDAFGLRTALTAAKEAHGSAGGAGALQFRIELTHSYLTRWEELLMVYAATHDRLPIANRDHPHKLGRLTVD